MEQMDTRSADTSDTPVDDAALDEVLATVERCLQAGLDRAAAVDVLTGGLLRLLAAGREDVFDTASREEVRWRLAPAFTRHHMAPVTDDEVNFAALTVSTIAVRAAADAVAATMRSTDDPQHPGLAAGDCV